VLVDDDDNDCENGHDLHISYDDADEDGGGGGGDNDAMMIIGWIVIAMMITFNFQAYFFYLLNFSLEQLASGDVTTMSKGQMREILAAASSSFGDQSKWDSSTLEKMSAFMGEMKYNEVSKIPVDAVRNMTQFLEYI